MDETDSPQTPPELLVILAALADEGIPVQTIAPKFTGRFNKGVDYVGDLRAVREGVPRGPGGHRLRGRAVRPAGEPEAERPFAAATSSRSTRRSAGRSREFGAGLHLKTAGHDLARRGDRPGRGRRRRARPGEGDLRQGAGEEGRACAPVRERSSTSTRPGCRRRNGRRLDVASSSSSALRHDPANPAFNPHLRQLIHVGYKVAAQMGDRYLKLLEAVRADDREERDREPVRAAPEAAVRG